jgi:hypothetical protein
MFDPSLSLRARKAINRLTMHHYKMLSRYYEAAGERRDFWVDYMNDNIEVFEV